jgi:tRNA nucleotidyltransferase (CCA-adding enzyme)
MPKPINLTDAIEKGLPAEAVELIKKAVAVAGSKKLPLYLVGGVVRDLLLGQADAMSDIDMAVEGDAVALALEFVEQAGGKLTAHSMFNTARIALDKWTVDFAMARTETYTRPGALPKVTPSAINNDLFRRDFTVNAMAIGMNPSYYGELIDLYGGMKDLDKKFIRVLHANSFIDDATRIWRAIRYEQRLGFKIETDTLLLIKRDVKQSKTVGGFRLRHELELVLKEHEPEKILARADELGALRELHPSLKADKWLADKFQVARQSDRATTGFYLGLLTYRLTDDEILQITKFLRFTAEQARAIHEIRELII